MSYVPFILNLNAEQARLLQDLVDGVAFIDAVKPPDPNDWFANRERYYRVYSHEGDSLGVYTQHDVESMIHRLKRAGYGYFKMRYYPPETQPGISLMNYNRVLGDPNSTHGTWMQGIEVQQSNIPVAIFSIKS